VAIATIVVACNRRENAGQTSAETQTVAPPEPREAPTDTDAMTQTVSIEDSRSEAEGGVLTSPNPPVKIPTDTTHTISPAATATAEKKTGTTKSRPPGRTQ
jgi:hypothetical protein